MQQRVSRWIRVMAVAAAATLTLASCSTAVDGSPTIADAPNANLRVIGDSHGSFDTSVKNALTDVTAFWKTNFPKVSGGVALPPLKGGRYSVDGQQVAQTGQLPGTVATEACAAQGKQYMVNNAAFCSQDDSIFWDRSPNHLLARLADKYGPLMVALIFAHEFGHAISYRLGVFGQRLSVIDRESQADCAAGAWAASALAHQDPHFRTVTPQSLDAALAGFLFVRDATPGTPQDVSHGNGFDRLSAVADGVDKGVTYCFSKGYFASRSYTERPFTTQKDYAAGGNEPLAVVLAPTNNMFVSDLNRFWSAAAKSVGKTFTPVKIAEAQHPKCGSPPTSEFGYCPDDNTVYYSQSFAQRAYNSLAARQTDPTTSNVTLFSNQPADFALGTLFAIGWGLAVRHQLFNRPLTDKAALTAAVCYTGAYAKDINVATANPGQLITLSPADLDEATSSMLNQVGDPKAYGSRHTTGLDRIQAFVKGYRGSLSVC